MGVAGLLVLEMVPNYVAEIPIIGTGLSEFLLSAFTSTGRSWCVVVLPVITLVLIEIHALFRIGKRMGGSVSDRAWSFRRPFLLAIAALAYFLPMPSQDGDHSDALEVKASRPVVCSDFLCALPVFQRVHGDIFGFYHQGHLSRPGRLPYFFRARAAKNSGPCRAASVRADASMQMLAAAQASGPRTLTKAIRVSVFLVAMTFSGPSMRFYPSTMGATPATISAGIRMGLPPPPSGSEKNPNLRTIPSWSTPLVLPAGCLVGNFWNGRVSNWQSRGQHDQKIPESADRSCGDRSLRGAAGCGGVGQPEEGRAVTKRFYDLISASRSRGTTPASEAYKLTTGQASN